MVARGPLKIVFLGTPEFAVPTFDALLASRHEIVAVVTQPDRPRGRGHRVSDAPIKARATTSGIAVLQPNRLSDPSFRTAAAALGADLGVVAAYGKILPEWLLELPSFGMINVHASLLPRHRGAAPVHRAVMAGDVETGVTIMRVVKALDAGPMMAKATRAIGPDETSDIVERDLAQLGARLLVNVVDDVAAGKTAETPQDDGAATYAPRLTKEDGVVDWSRAAAAIHNQIRGLHPWPHAFSFLDGRRFILIRSQVDVHDRSNAAPGTVVHADSDRLILATGNGLLRIVEIQPEGKRLLSAREFLAGHRIQPGAQFSGAP